MNRTGWDWEVEGPKAMLNAHTQLPFPLQDSLSFS